MQSSWARKKRDVRRFYVEARWSHKQVEQADFAHAGRRTAPGLSAAQRAVRAAANTVAPPAASAAAIWRDAIKAERLASGDSLCPCVVFCLPSVSVCRGRLPDAFEAVPQFHSCWVTTLYFTIGTLI